MSNAKIYSPEFKAKMALNALEGNERIAYLANQFRLPQVLISEWKDHLVANAPKLFLSQNDHNSELTG